MKDCPAYKVPQLSARVCNRKGAVVGIANVNRLMKFPTGFRSEMCILGITRIYGAASLIYGTPPEIMALQFRVKIHPNPLNTFGIRKKPKKTRKKKTLVQETKPSSNLQNMGKTFEGR